MTTSSDALHLDTPTSELDSSLRWVTGAAILHPSCNRTHTTSLDNIRILAVQRASTETAFPDQWELPGGHIESSDSTIRTALGREVSEETGLGVKTCLSRFEDLEWISGSGSKSLQINYLVTVDEEEVVLCEDEHQAFSWITRDEVERLEMTDGMRVVFGNAFACADRMRTGEHKA